MELKLIREFVEQSRALLGRDRVQTEDAALRITLPADAESALELLAWAFLGRVVALPSPSAAGQQKVLLEYDIHRNSMHVKRDSCEFDKNLHTGMVLASVALLVFFIAMTVVERAGAPHAAEEAARPAQAARPAKAGAAGPALAGAGAPPGPLAGAQGPAPYPLPLGVLAQSGKTGLQMNALGPIFGPIPTRARPRLPWSTDGHC
jgi:hypothetical protein